MTTPTLDLEEWQPIPAAEQGPGRALLGLRLEQPAIAAAVAALRGRIRVRDGQQGLTVTAGQHVGVAQLGPVRVRVRPKLQNRALWHVLCYGLGLSSVWRHEPTELSFTEAPFADLIAALLLYEAEGLLLRGLRSGYVARHAWLEAPRGRLDAAALRREQIVRAALPCRHHDLSPDTLVNRVVRAGLLTAARVAEGEELRASLLRQWAAWGERCADVPLSRALLDRADAVRGPLLAAYRPAHRLARLLLDGQGSDADHARGDHAVPGFLWDMARLFERFVRRYLREHVVGAEVVPQRALRLYRMVVDPRPRPAKAPRPRPDLLLLSGGQPVAVLDTKYRDLWTERLQREVLYQMSVYALAFARPKGQPVPAVVLYPGSGGQQNDVKLSLEQGQTGRRSPIILRAADWQQAGEMLRDQAPQRDLQALAQQWVRV